MAGFPGLLLASLPEWLVLEQKDNASMNYDEYFHLFDSSGAWVGFCLGRNLFDTDTVWRGWLPWDAAEVVDTNGFYLATIIGNRLYRFDHNRDLRIGYYPGYPPIPLMPDRSKPVAEKKLPLGATDVNLKSPNALPAGETVRRTMSQRAARGRSGRRRT